MTSSDIPSPNLNTVINGDPLLNEPVHSKSFPNTCDDEHEIVASDTSGSVTSTISSAICGSDMLLCASTLT